MSVDETRSMPIGDLPPILRAERHAAILPAQGWLWRIAPAYAGVFAAFPILDRLGVGPGRSLAGHAAAGAVVAQAIAAAVLGVLACHALLYYPLGLWGRCSRQRLAVTSASAFGTRGAEWIAGVLVAFGAIVSQAVALHMGIRLVLLGLLECGFLEESALEPWSLGPVRLESPVLLVTAVFWIFITGCTALLQIPSVIFALMQVYTPVALLLLAATALLAWFGPSAAAGVSDPVNATAFSPGVIVQLVFGAFAFPALFAVEWGMTADTRKDVRLGGWVGILFAGSFAAVVAILVVAGTAGRIGSGGSSGAIAADLVVPYSLHWAILRGIGGRVGGTILMLFGMAAVAPACYAIWVFSHRLHDHWNAISRWRWTWFGSVPALLLIATSWAGRLELVFGLMGAVFAPAAGVVVAEALRQGFRWEGIREGWNPPGVLAWAIGLAVGLLLRGTTEPAAVLAYLTAAGSYLVLSRRLPQRPVMVLDVEASPAAEPALAGGAGS